MAAPLSCQEAAQIVRMRLDHESVDMIQLVLGRGRTTIYRVLEACGLTGDKWGPGRGPQPGTVTWSDAQRSAFRATIERKKAQALEIAEQANGDEEEIARVRWRKNPAICNRCGVLLVSAPGGVGGVCGLCVAELRAGVRHSVAELPAGEIAQIVNQVLEVAA